MCLYRRMDMDILEKVVFLYVLEKKVYGLFIFECGICEFGWC